MTDFVDLAVYRRLNLWRVPNTRHPTSGLYAIPLTADELLTMNAGQIQALAVRPREVIRPPADKWTPRPELVKLWQSICTPSMSKGHGPTLNWQNRAEPLPDVVPYGKQHRALVSLAGTLRRRGLDEDTIFRHLMLFNADNLERPGPEKNIRAIAKSVAAYPIDDMPRDSTLWAILGAEESEGEQPKPANTQTPPVQAGEHLEQADRGFLFECLRRDEFGDAELMRHLYQHRIAYDHAEKAWYIWRGHAWVPDRKGSIKRIIPGQVAAQYLHLAAELTKEAGGEDTKEAGASKRGQADALMARAHNLRKLTRTQNVLNFATSLFGLTGDEWDISPDLLGTPTGVIDCRDGGFRPGQPSDYIRSVCPTEWKGLEEPAPRFEQFIAEILEQDGVSDDEQRARQSFLRRLLGYGITGQTTHHILPIFCGKDGRNGKDTLFEVLGETLGPLADAVSSDILLARQDRAGRAEPHLYDLRGKRLVWSSETNEGAQLNAGQAKLIVGGGRLKVRPLYGNMVMFKPTHLLILITNRKPHVPVDDAALWARLVVMSFDRRFVPEPDPAKRNERKSDENLKEKLLTERSGILAWLVRGAIEWRKEGLAPPDSVRLTTKEYRKDEDIVASFVEHCCMVDEDLQAGAMEMYRRYQKWAAEIGETPIKLTTFGKRMSERFKKGLEAKVTTYFGLGLIPEPTTPSSDSPNVEDTP